MSRILIVAPIIVVVGVLIVLFLRYINKPTNDNNKETIKPKKSFIRTLQPREQESGISAQEILGLADIVGPDIIMRDGAIINIFRVGCANVSLMTRSEEIEEGKRTARVLSTLRQGFAIIKIHRPADNTHQIKRLQKIKDDVENQLSRFQGSTRKQTTKDYHERQHLLARHDFLSAKLMAETENERKDGELYITETFICVKTKAKRNSQKTAAEISRQLLTRLNANGYPARRLSDLELIDVNKAYFDEPTGQKINIDPRRQIPKLDIKLWKEVVPDALKHNELISDETTIDLCEEEKPKNDPVTREEELDDIMAEIEAMSNPEREIEHVA